MTKLIKLKEAKNLSELARLLGYQPKGLSYILYKIDENNKYRTFKICKKHGGKRTINAPHPKLSLLQKRLAQMLYECLEEHKKERKKDDPPFWPASHGFQKKRTIVSNAEAHKRKRFVFNLDLEDFFGTINFGRVRGFFIKDRMFKLDPAVATVIAQIACHENKLPQGSPCSPIISNLIGNILDSRLLALARDAQCTYTRYADDLTFSKNKGDFPPEIAIEMDGGKWVVGEKLEHAIKLTGFTINASKTRMSLKKSRQAVTGLVVNKKVNVKQEYYRNARAMCDSLFKTGRYHRPYESSDEKTDNLNHLEGTLAHIYFVKYRRDRDYKTKSYSGFTPPKTPKDLYKKFLFYKHFIALSAPLIITEGLTDIAYLKTAISVFATQFPSLIGPNEDGDLRRKIKFLNPSNTIQNVLGLAEGTGGQSNLIYTYEDSLKKYDDHPTIKHPAIILCDNDEGAKEIFKAAKKNAKVEITKESNKDFYELFENLYLVKIPTGAGSEIEHLFSKEFKKDFLKDKTADDKKEYIKNTRDEKKKFVEKAVSKTTDPKDFEGFIPLLERIQGAIKHHKDKK